MTSTARRLRLCHTEWQRRIEGILRMSSGQGQRMTGAGLTGY
jgi:hypothetical protein